MSETSKESQSACMGGVPDGSSSELLARMASRHPCFAQGQRRMNAGRIHLPVSPACNLGCRFCERSVNSHEQRPGVTAHTLSPELALAAVRRAMAEQAPGCTINVVGIAGPGDALASDAALQAFRLVRREFPQLIRCMSTNGLLLPQKAAELVEAGVETLTVTVNDVNSERLARINDYVVYEGRRLAGREAAELLIAQQLEGIRRVSAAGVLVKVNTVLVPSVNGGYIGEIARTVAEAGASLYNIIPLIPQHKMAGEAAPTCDELEDARLEAEGFIEVFRHCQHCRADAIGIPGGTDISGRVYAGMFDEASELATMATFSHG